MKSAFAHTFTHWRGSGPRWGWRFERPRLLFHPTFCSPLGPVYLHSDLLRLGLDEPLDDERDRHGTPRPPGVFNTGNHVRFGT